jgi:hypothetical protein
VGIGLVALAWHTTPDVGDCQTLGFGGSRKQCLCLAQKLLWLKHGGVQLKLAGLDL